MTKIEKDAENSAIEALVQDVLKDFEQRQEERRSIEKRWELNMNFCYASLMEPGEVMPDAYERLLLDVMLDDRMLFIRSDSIRAAWQLLDPVIASATPLHYYPAGTSITEKI